MGGSATWVEGGRALGVVSISHEGVVTVAARAAEVQGLSHTMKNSPLAFVQAGPMDPWAPMQKAFLDALVLH